MFRDGVGAVGYSLDSREGDSGRNDGRDVCVCAWRLTVMNVYRCFRLFYSQIHVWWPKVEGANDAQGVGARRLGALRRRRVQRHRRVLLERRGPAHG